MPNFGIKKQVCRNRVGICGKTGAEFTLLRARPSLRDFAPELVILDIGLPDMSGYEVARQLRQEYGAQAFHLVALSGFSDEQTPEPEAAAFDRYLLKPAGKHELQALLRDL